MLRRDTELALPLSFLIQIALVSRKGSAGSHLLSFASLAHALTLYEELKSVGMHERFAFWFLATTMEGSPLAKALKSD